MTGIIVFIGIILYNNNNLWYTKYSHPQKKIDIAYLLMKLNFDTYFIFSSHIDYHHPSIIPYQHSQSPCWYQMESVKGNYPNYIQIHNIITFYPCRFYPVPKLLIINDPEISNTPKFCPPRSHWLRQDNFHITSTRGNQSASYPWSPFLIMFSVCRQNPPI